jgi:hypothetical protein
MRRLVALRRKEKDAVKEEQAQVELYDSILGYDLFDWGGEDLMGKRSDFVRRPRDFYATPREAVLPLLPFLPKKVLFDEPCCGDGALACVLEEEGHSCASATDIAPQGYGDVGDAMALTQCFGSMFITNPPWDRAILHAIIERLSPLAPTWLLIDAPWMHTKQAAPYLRHCDKIVSIGRVKWIPGSACGGKDDCCWYLFSGERRAAAHAPLFFGRKSNGA